MAALIISIPSLSLFASSPDAAPHAPLYWVSPR